MAIHGDVRLSSKMESVDYITLFLGIVAVIVFFRFRRDGKRLPPSPLAFPIIGHLPLLRPPLHLSICEIAKRYGPLVFLRLGTRPALVVSSPELVEEIHSKTTIFANRPDLYVGKVVGQNNSSMFFAPFGPHYQNLRRIMTNELLTTGRLNKLADARREELVSMLRGMVNGGGELAIRETLMKMTFNVLRNMAAGRRLHKGDDGKAEVFDKIIKDLLEVTYGFNPRDFFPALGWMDLTGVERRVRKLSKRMEAFAAVLVEERRKMRKSEPEIVAGEPRSLVDVMLESEPGTYTDLDIRCHVLLILLAGTDSVPEAAEAAMRILLSHPEVMKKARSEIDTNVEAGKLLSESDMVKLPYLQCVLKEVLRLAPVTLGHPPHASSEDTTINGYHIPRGTMVFVDVWGIQRNPAFWDDPTSFKPERFDGHVGWREGFQYFPFSVGRRTCPGENLGVRIAIHAVALFLQCFDWEPMTEEEVDLTGLLGTTAHSSKVVIGRYKVRECMKEALSEVAQIR